MADPQTRVMGGDGTSTLSYALAPGVFQYIESVLVEVDATAGGDAQPVLSVLTHDGVVIAAKQQGDVIPAGDTGRATWALRLTDKQPTSRTVRLGIEQLDETVALNMRLFSSYPAVATTGTSPAAGALTAVCTFGAANRRFTLPVNNGDRRGRVFHVHSLTVQRLDVLAFERLDGANVLVAAGGSDLLTVNTHKGGAVLLDISTPSLPKVINAGTYAFTTWVQWT